MRKFTKQIVAGLVATTCFTNVLASCPIMSGFYGGIGGGWNNTDEHYKSAIFVNPTTGAVDVYDESVNRLSPTVQVGYWSPINCTRFLWGTSLQWQYTGYETPNERPGRGQHLPNATFSSINIFGPEVLRDFSSQTELTNRVTLLMYVGERVKRGYVYVGVGPALFTARNSVYVSSVHTPNGTGNKLISTSVEDDEVVWGGAAQVGYSHYVSPTCFVNINYTFSKSLRHDFDNSVNTAVLNGASVPGPTVLDLDRRIRLTDQGIFLSVNKVF